MLHWHHICSLLLFWVIAIPVQASPDPYQEILQRQLLEAEPGAVITIPEGVFNFDNEVSIDVNGITLRGQGSKRSVLRFKEQASGAQGLLVTANQVTLENFGVEDAKGDGIKAVSTLGLTIRGVRVSWSSAQQASNGGYGLYPVKSAQVLIEHCEVTGASDAGIYVGQSRQVIVRNNEAFGNVAGIEIENTYDADVYENFSHDNTAGILVFNLPDLSQLGGRTRVFRNRMVMNNGVNFAAPSNTVADVPQGTGLMLLAAKNVEVFDNELSGNQTTNIILANYQIIGRPVNDPSYDPYIEAIAIHHNRFSDTGIDPRGGSSENSQAMIQALREIIPLPFPDAIYDGSFNPRYGSRQNVPSDKRLCLKADQGLRFINLDLPGEMRGMSTDLQGFQCELAPLPAIILGATL